MVKKYIFVNVKVKVLMNIKRFPQYPQTKSSVFITAEHNFVQIKKAILSIKTNE